MKYILIICVLTGCSASKPLPATSHEQRVCVEGCVLKQYVPGKGLDKADVMGDCELRCR